MISASVTRRLQLAAAVAAATVLELMLPWPGGIVPQLTAVLAFETARQGMSALPFLLWGAAVDWAVGTPPGGRPILYLLFALLPLLPVISTVRPIKAFLIADFLTVPLLVIFNLSFNGGLYFIEGLLSALLTFATIIPIRALRACV